MRLRKEISELVNAEVISPETAQAIHAYYRNREGQETSRLLIVFGILGAILMGLGVILIIAHNWDDLPRSTKTMFAFLPLLIGQAACGLALFNKNHSPSWREGAGSFLFFAVGASISLVSQIYHIQGELSEFILTWMVLCIPLVYVMRSSIASLLYLSGITFYACEAAYWTYPQGQSYYFWLLLLLVLPHYYSLFRKRPASNFTIFHNWLIPISLVITLGTLAQAMEELMIVAYFSLFGFFYSIGNLGFFKQQKPIYSGYRTIGSFGTVILLISFSFDWFWKELIDHDYPFPEVLVSPELLTSIVLTLLAGGILFWQQRKSPFREMEPVAPIFVLFILTFIIGHFLPFSVVIINLLVLAIGITTVRNGAVRNHLGLLNYGLLIITALVICRFFDSDLSFVFRGVLFLLVGAGFFAANYWMLKKRRADG